MLVEALSWSGATAVTAVVLTYAAVSIAAPSSYPRTRNANLPSLYTPQLAEVQTNAQLSLSERAREDSLRFETGSHHAHGMSGSLLHAVDWSTVLFGSSSIVGGSGGVFKQVQDSAADAASIPVRQRTRRTMRHP